MKFLSLKMENQIVVNKKTDEELFFHCNIGDKNVTVTVKRMTKKKRCATIKLQIAPFSTFGGAVEGRILSEPVTVGGHSWRILAMRYHFLVLLFNKDSKSKFVGKIRSRYEMVNDGKIINNLIVSKI